LSRATIDCNNNKQLAIKPTHTAGCSEISVSIFSVREKNVANNTIIDKKKLKRVKYLIVLKG